MNKEQKEERRDEEERREEKGPALNERGKILWFHDIVFQNPKGKG